MNRGRFIVRFAVVVVVLAMTLTLGGCSTLKKQGDSASAGTTGAQQQSEEFTSYYQDFGDILLPGQMEVEKKGTFVFQTPGLSAGVLALKGRVESNSLIAFFQSNMAKDNWRQVSSFKSTVPRSMMLYQKENRWCVIAITDKGFNTYAEIWVAPTIGEGQSGLLK